MNKALTVIFLLAFSLSAFSQSAMKPVVEWMRQAPAWIDGQVTFTGNYNLFKDANTTVELLKGKPLYFDVQENHLVLYPRAALFVEYRGIDVTIEQVTWTLENGFKIKAVVASDPFGLTQSFVSKRVTKILSDVLSDRMMRANQQLYRIRGMKQVGTTVVIVKEIIRIFNRRDVSKGESQPLPTYRGEAGLNFNPPTKQGFTLGPVHVSLRQRDNFRVGFSFTGTNQGIIPYAMTATSAVGLNINTGKEYKQNARLVLTSLEADKNGARIKLHLGASETIGILLTAAEEIAWRTGNPMQRCETCFELAEMPALRLMAEGIFREGLLKQVEFYTPVLKQLQVAPENIASFKKKEGCRIQGSQCARTCRLKHDDDKKTEACIESCNAKMNACLKR